MPENLATNWLRVLIVDDNKDTVDSLAMLLWLNGSQRQIPDRHPVPGPDVVLRQADAIVTCF
jgi:hypothetical protein